MSALTSNKRRLNPKRVYVAQKMNEKKVQFARQLVLDRATRDAEFAADVLKAVGENLPKEVMEACKKTILEAETKTLVEKWEKTVEVSGESLKTAVLVESQPTPLFPEDVPLGDGFVATQSDGGGTIIVHETELPRHPRDSE